MGENYNLCLSAFDDVVEKIAELQMDITKKSLIKVDIKVHQWCHLLCLSQVTDSMYLATEIGYFNIN